MTALFESGRIVDLILALVAGEALLLAGLRRLGLGPPLPGLIVNLASGAALMCALRAALTGSTWPTVAAWMLAGLAFHLADLFLRFRRVDRRALRRRPGDAGAGTSPELPRSRAATT